MNVNYITLFNGLTLLIKPTCRLGQSLQCYHYFNNSWIPLELNINAIADMRNIEIFDSEPPKEHLTINNSTSTNSGKKIFKNTTMDIKFINLESSKESSKDTVISPVFPEIDSNWFYTGFPSKLKVGGTSGNLIEYIPIYFYATKDGNEMLTLPKLPDRLGYLDKNSVFHEDLIFEGPFEKGDLLFTLLLNKNTPSCSKCKIINTSYWKILSEYSNIDARSETNKSITFTSGTAVDNRDSMALCIGSNIADNSLSKTNHEILDKISNDLSHSFNSNVCISEELTTTHTIRFKPQPKAQRIATYQFVEKYTLDSTDSLEENISFFNNKTKNFIATFAKGKFEARSFNYNTNYFASAFVLNPI